MRRFACIVPLVAALFFVAACGSDPYTDQPPFTAAELDRFLKDNHAVIDAIQKAAFRCRNLSREEGNRVLKAAKADAIRELGWDLDRFEYILACCRDALSQESLRASIDELTAKTGDAMPQADRDALRIQIQKMEAALDNITTRTEARTTVAERVFINERMPALRGNSQNDVVIQPFKYK